MPASARAVIAAALLGWPAAAPGASERMTVLLRPATACVSWAAWREHGQASLTTKGARRDRHCPIRLAAKTRVSVIEEDAGEGASRIRHLGQIWFVDAQELE